MGQPKRFLQKPKNKFVDKSQKGQSPSKGDGKLVQQSGDELSSSAKRRKRRKLSSSNSDQPHATKTRKARPNSAGQRRGQDDHDDADDDISRAMDDDGDGDEGGVDMNDGDGDGEDGEEQRLLAELSQNSALESLPWRVVSRDADIDGFVDNKTDGFMMLEELDNVEVEFVELPGGGKVATIKPSKQADRKASQANKKSAKQTEPGAVVHEKSVKAAKAPKEKASKLAAATTATPQEPVKKLSKKAKKALKLAQAIANGTATAPEPRASTKQSPAEKLVFQSTKAEQKPCQKTTSTETTSQVLSQKKTQQLQPKSTPDSHPIEKMDVDDEEEEEDDDEDEEEENEDDDVGADFEAVNDNEAKNSELDMSAWEALGVHPTLIKGLRRLGFDKPTPIQEQTIPFALKEKRHVLGAAETGSGKTLAFGIPILQHILEQRALAGSSDEENRGGDLVALIIAPARELAIQVHDHLVAVSKEARIKIAAIVGGLATQKQERLLRGRPEIVVGTPGRVWDLIHSKDAHLSNLQNLKFFVVDEADRMIERGHFQELDSIIGVLPTGKSLREVDAAALAAEQDSAMRKISNMVNPTARPTIKQKQNADGSAPTSPSKIYKFVFSATLLPLHEKKGGKKVKAAANPSSVAESLEHVVKRLEITNPFVVDLTRTEVVSASLVEAHITCDVEEKDLYLYYFLKRHVGKTVVFANSIDCIRRVLSIFALLDMEPLGLHASMQQRQRLKNLERFKANPNAVIICTDVAARGLDIPDIQHVVHYQLPRNSELYVHRSGRTARAHREGISVALVSAEDLKFYKTICHDLHKENGMPSFPIDMEYLPTLRAHLKLARKIDKESHSIRRVKNSNDWFKKAAEELDIELDDDLIEGEFDEEDGKGVSIKKELARLESQKRDLKKLIRDAPILPKGFSRSYMTFGTEQDTVQKIIHAKGGEMLSQTSAIDALKNKNKRKRAVDDSEI